MSVLGIPNDAVKFKACPGGRFSARPSGNTTAPYIVEYPSEAKSGYLSPITHELAHVFQMQKAGGLEPLRRNFETRKIELGADFITGLVYSKMLSHMKLADFETNLELAGSYRVDATHGLPTHRTTAFRLGVHKKDPYEDLTVEEALTYWNSNDYPLIQ
jgi:hypothetical protein